MQHDPNKNAYNPYANQYPPMHQPQYGAGGAYPSANVPPPYSQYPQAAGGYPAPGYPSAVPMHQQQYLTPTPVYSSWNQQLATPITSGLKSYFIISGLLYLVWSALAVGLEIGIISNSYWTYYRGIWAGVFLISCGITMLVASCRASYIMARLVGLLVATLCICIIAFIMSIVNITSSYRCTSATSWYFCDSVLAYNLKLTILVLFIITVIHTIVNLVVVSKAQKHTTTATAPGVPGH